MDILVSGSRKQILSIVGKTTAPRAFVGICPGCRTKLRNPPQSNSLSLRWAVDCPKCHAEITIRNPRWEKESGRREHVRGRQEPRRQRRGGSKSKLHSI